MRFVGTHGTLHKSHIFYRCFENYLTDIHDNPSAQIITLARDSIKIRYSYFLYIFSSLVCNLCDNFFITLVTSSLSMSSPFHWSMALRIKCADTILALNTCHVCYHVFSFQTNYIVLTCNWYTSRSGQFYCNTKLIESKYYLHYITW